MPRQISPLTLDTDDDEMNFRARPIPKDLADLDASDARLPDPPAAPEYLAIPIQVPEPLGTADPEPEAKGASAKKAAPARKAAPPRKKKA